LFDSFSVAFALHFTLNAFITCIFFGQQFNQHPIVRVPLNLFAKLDGKYFDFLFLTIPFTPVQQTQHIRLSAPPFFFCINLLPHHLFFLLPSSSIHHGSIFSHWLGLGSSPISYARVSNRHGLHITHSRLCLHLIYLLLSSTRLRYRRISYRHHVLMLCAKSLKLFGWISFFWLFACNAYFFFFFGFWFFNKG